MSHSKYHKRGRSLYLDNWNPNAKKYINECKLCGNKGYSPAIEQSDFYVVKNGIRIHFQLIKRYMGS